MPNSSKHDFLMSFTKTYLRVSLLFLSHLGRRGKKRAQYAQHNINKKGCTLRTLNYVCVCVPISIIVYTWQSVFGIMPYLSTWASERKIVYALLICLRVY